MNEKGRLPLNQTVRRLLIAASATFSLLAMTACGEADREVANTVPLPRILVSSPAWSGVGDDQVVATIDDIKIPAWRVRRALGEAPAGTTAAQALDLVIAEELVARKAAGDEGFTPDRKVFEKVLATRWVEKHLIEDFGPEDVPMSMLQEAFAMPQVWAKFNHYDLYEILDYQWICCPDPDNCDPAASEECFREGETTMATVWTALDREKPAMADLKIMTGEYRKLAYKLTYQEYQFAFDKTAGYQKGMSHIDTKLADALMKAEPGVAVPPVRSDFGWHVPFVKTHYPEVHGDLNDPAVRLEVATVFLQRFRQQHFLELLGGLIPVDSLLLLDAYFEKRGAPPGKPVYDVVVDRQALREATAVELDRSQEETPNL